jgi:hypothetical protein
MMMDCWCDAVPFGLHRPVVEATGHLPGVQVSAEWARNALGEDSHVRCFHGLNQELLPVFLWELPAGAHDNSFLRSEKEVYILSTLRTHRAAGSVFVSTERAVVQV